VRCYLYVKDHPPSLEHIPLVERDTSIAEIVADDGPRPDGHHRGHDHFGDLQIAKRGDIWAVVMVE